MKKEKALWPAWRWKNGEGRVFQCEADVPPGWTTAHDRTDQRPAAEIVAQADLNNDGVIEPSKAEIIKALRARGVEFDARWSIPRLQALL